MLPHSSDQSCNWSQSGSFDYFQDNLLSGSMKIAYIHILSGTYLYVYNCQHSGSSTWHLPHGIWISSTCTAQWLPTQISTISVVKKANFLTIRFSSLLSLWMERTHDPSACSLCTRKIERWPPQWVLIEYCITVWLETRIKEIRAKFSETIVTMQISTESTTFEGSQPQGWASIADCFILCYLANRSLM